ncbi:MAG: hypothetical protein SGPRY_001511 [Prymnesium sp.]
MDGRVGREGSLGGVGEVSERVGVLCAAASRVHAATASQLLLEAEIQACCHSVWKIGEERYTVSGSCGEGGKYSVSHQYTQQIAQIDAPKFEALRKGMDQHLHHATTELVPALFERSLCELRLVMVLKGRVLNEEHPLAPDATLQLLKALLECMGSNEATLDAQSLPFLRKLVLLLGSQYISSAPCSSGKEELPSLNCQLLHIFYSGRACGWAAPLLQPGIRDVIESRWLWYILINQPAEVGALPPEADVIAFVTQVCEVCGMVLGVEVCGKECSLEELSVECGEAICGGESAGQRVDWLHLRDLETQDVEAFVVQPIHRVLRRVCESNQARTLLLLGKVLTAAVCAHPSLTSIALTAITRSTVRAALLCAPYLALWRWQLSPPEALWKAWCELYRVSPTRIDDFAQRHPQQQLAQQKEFTSFLLSHALAVSSTYEIEPFLASLNDHVTFPILSLLRRLALHAAIPSIPHCEPEPRLTRLLAISVMELSNENADALRLEAASNLSALCTEICELVSEVIEEVVIQIPVVASDPGGAERICSLLAAMSLEAWQFELEQLDLLSSLLTHATMSFLTHTPAKPRAGLSISAHALLSSATGSESQPVPPPTGALSRKQLEAALAPRALPSAERETVEAGLRVKATSGDRPLSSSSSSDPLPLALVQVGCMLFAKVEWAAVDQGCRQKGLLLLLGSRAHVPSSWWWGQLLSAPGKELIETELPADTFEMLMQAVPLGCEPIPGAFTAVQCMLLVAAVERQASHGTRSSLPEMGMLYSLWERMAALLEVEQYGAFRQLLARVLGVLACSPGEVPSALPPMMGAYMALAPSHAEAIRMMMADKQGHSRWLTVWSSLLSPLVATDECAASLLDSLVHGAFSSGELVVADSQIAEALLRCQLTKRQV